MPDFASHALLMFGRALRLRCPNIVAAELVFAAVFLVIVLATWPSPPRPLLQYGGIALMVIAPFVLFPFSKTLFLAFDLLFRPSGS